MYLVLLVVLFFVSPPLALALFALDVVLSLVRRQPEGWPPRRRSTVAERNAYRWEAEPQRATRPEC